MKNLLRYFISSFARGHRTASSSERDENSTFAFRRSRILNPLTIVRGSVTLVLVSVIFSGTAIAQDTDRTDAQLSNTPAPTYVIRNARIVTVSGADIENGAVVISDGKIAAVGANVSAPAGAREIDGRGLIVYPGMIDLATNMGLVEVPTGAPGTVDAQELGDMNPNISAVWSVNPHSATLRSRASPA